jgi:hypothetical protein
VGVGEDLRGRGRVVRLLLLVREMDVYVHAYTRETGSPRTRQRLVACKLRYAIMM